MKIIKMILKVAAAGIVSIAIISLLLCLYSITPVHENNPQENTDYIWPANSIWVNVTEGMSFGKIDKNGYNNVEVVENPNVLILGSSHSEAFNVMQSESLSYVLSEKLKGNFSVYNKSISGHSFYKVCQYLKTNLELYDEAPKVVVLETVRVDVPQDLVDQVISSSISRKESHSTGLIGMMQRVPFFRVVYHQMVGGLMNLFMPSHEAASGDSDIVPVNPDSELDTVPYDTLFSYLSNIEKEYNTKIVIFYHPTETLTAEGDIQFNTSAELDAFRSFANKYDISFIDLAERFTSMYYNENHVPHGFPTGKLGSGHLNKYGHYAVADELYNEIIKLEEEGKICK